MYLIVNDFPCTNSALSTNRLLLAIIMNLAISTQTRTFPAFHFSPVIRCQKVGHIVHFGQEVPKHCSTTQFHVTCSKNFLYQTTQTLQQNLHMHECSRCYGGKFCLPGGATVKTSVVLGWVIQFKKLRGNELPGSGFLV